jgi:hypothetical protein
VPSRQDVRSLLAGRPGVDRAEGLVDDSEVPRHRHLAFGVIAGVRVRERDDSSVADVGGQPEHFGDEAAFPVEYTNSLVLNSSLLRGR